MRTQRSFHQKDRLYFLPIGGTAMAPLAGFLASLGHRVQGVDAQLYPPMSTLLEELGIEVRIGYDPNQVPAELDRVIIGNAVPQTNPEVQEVIARGIPYLSQAEAVAHYVLAEGRQSVVVAGTHGKTTTSGMVAWILERAGFDPSFLVGGLPRWSQRAFRVGRGRWLVIEGDEYNTAFFDRGPKFLHYRPRVFVLGPVEFDHADIYRDLDAVLTAFRAGTAQVPKSGAVVVNAWSAAAVDACRDAVAQLVTVGPRGDCALQLKHVDCGHEVSAAEVVWQGVKERLEIPMAGLHNLQNASLALAAALTAEVSLTVALEALASFPGVARRLDLVGEASGVAVVDDFAHHPTALAVTIAASRQRWRGRRLVVAYEPRSLSAARRGFQKAYLEALATADVVLVAAPFHRGRVAPDELIDRPALAVSLGERGVTALVPAEDEDPVRALLPELAPGDVVIGCSSGDFGGFHRRLLAVLEQIEQQEAGL